MIIRNLRPFALHESPGFAGFLLEMHLDAEQRTAMTERLKLWHSNAIPAIKAFLQTHLGDFLFSVSVDGWTTGATRKAMYCLVLHFLTKDFTQVCLPLDVSRIHDKTAQGIKEWIRKVLARYALSFDHLFCLTSDEAAPEQCATTLIQCFRVPCVPHRLSNVVKTAFQELGLAAKEDEELARMPLVEATKSMIKFINNKGAVRIFFEEKQEEHELRRKNQLYCKTRFIGSLLMGEIFLENRQAVSDVVTKASVEDAKPWTECPEFREENWNRWLDVMTCTCGIGDAVTRMSGAYFATVNCILPDVIALRHSLQLSLSRLQDGHLSTEEKARYLSPEGPRLVMVLVDRFAHYFEKDLDNPVILLACFLDPRYRDWGAKSKETLVQGKDESNAAFSRRRALVEYFRTTWNSVSSKMRECLYAVYKKYFPATFAQDAQVGNWANSPIIDEANSFASQQALTDYSVDWTGPTKEQPFPPVVTAKTNVLKWWKNCNPQHYWRLHLVVRAVMAVPGSAVACERIWSSGGRAFTKNRGSLSAETGGKQVFLHEIMKAQENIQFLAENLIIPGLNKGKK